MTRLKLSLLLVALALLPLAAAGPLSVVCGADCRIDAASTGYSPVAAALPMGGSVTWHSTDITHVTRDQGVTAGAPACFEVGHVQFEDSPAVRFDIDGSALFATVEGVTTKCASALVTPAAAVLPYFCSLHPTMRASLVVTAV